MTAEVHTKGRLPHLSSDKQLTFIKLTVLSMVAILCKYFCSDFSAIKAAQTFSNISIYCHSVFVRLYLIYVVFNGVAMAD